MTNQHPISPPPELVNKWANLFEFHSDAEVFTEAARWGADQELEACCEWLVRNYNYPEAGNPLRAARRPKPPSLKEQALKALKVLPTPDGQVTLDITDLNTIRRALEALPND
jgi:hypothetical protein